MIDKDKPYLIYCCIVQCSEEDTKVLEALPDGELEKIDEQIKKAVEEAHPIQSAQVLVFQPKAESTKNCVSIEALCVDAMKEKGLYGLLELMRGSVKERKKRENSSALLFGESWF